jgi:hypothetical protein
MAMIETHSQQPSLAGENSIQFLWAYQAILGHSAALIKTNALWQEILK